MSIKAIIFDKDGTLIDFDSFWLTISQKAIADILKSINREDISVEEVLAELGVKDGVTSINGVLCYGTYTQMSSVIYNVLKKHGCELSEAEAASITTDAYHNNYNAGILRPTCENIYDVLVKLKGLGIKLAVVTTDDEKMTKKCLDGLGIEPLFEKVYTDDGTTPVKPDPYCISALCGELGISKSEIIMVGDTLTDANFAKNGGIKMIGVAKSETNKEILAPHTNVVVPDISYIYDILTEGTL